MPLGFLQHCSTKFQKKIQIPRAHPPRPDYHLGPHPGVSLWASQHGAWPGVQLCKAPRASPPLPMARGGRITVEPGVGTTSPHARAPVCLTRCTGAQVHNGPSHRCTTKKPQMHPTRHHRCTFANPQMLFGPHGKSAQMQPQMQIKRIYAKKKYRCCRCCTGANCL